MSVVKMTDILVATSAFVATLTYPVKGKVGEWSEQNQEEILLEVYPISAPEYKNLDLAKSFFQVICSDPSVDFRHFKETTLKALVQASTKKIFEEFWESARSLPLENICLDVPQITCVLYDIQGNVQNSVKCIPLNIIWAFNKIEEAFFTHTMPGKQDARALTPAQEKSRTREWNRATHKYFLHHRSR